MLKRSILLAAAALVAVGMGSGPAFAQDGYYQSRDSQRYDYRDRDNDSRDRGYRDDDRDRDYRDIDNRDRDYQERDYQERNYQGRNYYGEQCHEQNRTAGTVAGAIIGGIIGNQFGSGGGKAAATVGGVVLGGALGNSISGDIDCEDRPEAFRAYHRGFEGPIGQRQSWRGRGKARGYIVTQREYRSRGRVCRDFYEVTYRHGREYRRNGTACRYRGGEWRFR
jgi:surface antigen